MLNNIHNTVESIFIKSILTKEKCLKNGLECIENMGNEIVISIKNGGKIMICGNGGSAADAQHLAAEMLIRLRPNNKK